MAAKKTILESMRINPKKDWTIGDVEKLCAQNGLDFAAATRGSHYKVTSAHLSKILTVPFKRPIKTHYIKDLVGMVDAHLAAKVRAEAKAKAEAKKKKGKR